MGKAKLLRLSLIVGLVWGSAGVVNAQSKPLKKIRVGVPSVGVANIIIFVTKEAKLYEKYGLDGEVITINGSGIASKALISGNIDICPVATPTVIARESRRIGYADSCAYYARRRSCADGETGDQAGGRSQGKKIAVSSLGSLTDFLVKAIAKKKGLNPDRDFTFIQMGGDGERIAALKAGVVDAAALSHPGYGTARKLGFPMLWDAAKELDYPWMEITTRRATIKSDRELVMNYVKAHLDGIALFKKIATSAAR